MPIHSDASSLQQDHDSRSSTSSSITLEIEDPSTPLPILPPVPKSKSSAELEMEELKGFMDLGFEFRRENLSDRLILLIPGLRRLADEDPEIEEETEITERPYLSESWVWGSQDLKWRLKLWARTVASSLLFDQTTQINHSN